jgi:AraC-like DNA-binding protein
MRRSTNRDDYQSVPRPVAAMAKEFEAGHVITPHRHPRGQLVFAAVGIMTVTTPAGTWVVPPQRAVWVPPDIEHTIRMSGRVAMRTVYVDPTACRGFPKACCVVAVTSLLRELILAAVGLPVLYDVAGRDGRVMALILDEIRASPTLPLRLPLPGDSRLRRLAQELMKNPSDSRPLAAWARHVGASRRTLARRFRAETGLSFALWRQQARLLAALNRLAAGTPVTQVAFDTGYHSPRAFISMFRRTLGTTPHRYFAAQRTRA